MPAALQTVSTITDFVNLGTDPRSLSEHSISTRLREIVKPKALVKSNPDEPSRKWASLSLPKMCERGSRTLRTTTILKIWIQPFFRPSGDTSISHRQRCACARRSTDFHLNFNRNSAFDRPAVLPAHPPVHLPEQIADQPSSSTRPPQLGTKGLVRPYVRSPARVQVHHGCQCRGFGSAGSPYQWHLLRA